MKRRPGIDRAQLADAAVRVADDSGLEAVTIARVASELGVRGPSLYHHVANREGLVREVALRGLADLTADLAMASAGRAGADALLATGSAYRAYAAKFPGRYAAGVRAPAPDDEELIAAGARALDLLTAALRGFALDADDEVHAARALRAALHGFVSLEAGGGFALPVDADADESFARMLTLLLSGIAAASAEAAADRPHGPGQVS